VISDTDYTVRSKIITDPPRTTTYDVGVTVHTVVAGGVTIGDFNAGLTDRVTTQISDMREELQALSDYVTSAVNNANGRQWNNKQMVQTQLQSVTGSLSASITQVMTVATDTQGALASFETDVGVQFGDQSALITENATAIADINSGLVASWSLTLDVNGYVSGMKQLNDGTTSIFAINVADFQLAHPDVNGGAPVVMFDVTTIAGVPTFTMNGNFITPNSVTAAQISVGSLSAISATLGDVKSGTWQSLDGLMLIDGNNKRIVFSQ
jgi:hypothetical protein